MRPDKTGGFTLVELLVSLALTAALAIFVLDGIDIVRRAWEVSRNRETADETDATDGRLRELLARSMPTNWIDDKSGLARLAFEGHSDSISFVTLNEIAGARGGLMRVRLAASRERPGRLTFRTGVFRSDRAAAQEERSVDLFANVTRFAITYFGAQGIGQPDQWRSDWIEQDCLPKLVQLEVTIGGKPRFTRLQIPVALRMAR